MELTSKQTQILTYIKNTYVDRGCAPSVREICNAVNLKSTSSVQAHLDKLEEKGYIRRDSTKSRSIEILDERFNLHQSKGIANIPIVGSVAAGQPILAQENIESYFPIPSELAHNKNEFILKVKGESMINANIYDGDHIIVRQQEDAEDGDIVVALLDDSATVKRFYKENNHIRLQPENDSMEPIIVPYAKILGKVTGLMRIMC